MEYFRASRRASPSYYSVFSISARLYPHWYPERSAPHNIPTTPSAIARSPPAGTTSGFAAFVAELDSAAAVSVAVWLLSSVEVASSVSSESALSVAVAVADAVVLDEEGFALVNLVSLGDSSEWENAGLTRRRRRSKMSPAAGLQTFRCRWGSCCSSCHETWR